KDSLGNSVDVVVKNSTVNMNEIGDYVVTVVAMDSFGNEFEREIKVKVVDEPTSVGQTFVENFTTFSLAGSGYVSGSFVGVKGITWSYVGAREDIALNGSALTFGGRNND